MKARQNFKVIISNKYGFSLLELMMVVAIIGVISVVAIPNFTRFMGKARASEASSQLAALFTAQKAFQAEYNSFHSDLSTIGYQPTGDLRYTTGIGAASAHTVLGIVLDPTHFSTAVNCPLAGSNCQNAALNAAGAIMAALTTPGSATNTTFTARSEGFVGGAVNDVWRIDETKTIVNEIPGGY